MNYFNFLSCMAPAKPTLRLGPLKSQIDLDHLPASVVENSSVPTLVPYGSPTRQENLRSVEPSLLGCLTAGWEARPQATEGGKEVVRPLPARGAPKRSNEAFAAARGPGRNIRPSAWSKLTLLYLTENDTQIRMIIYEFRKSISRIECLL